MLTVRNLIRIWHLAEFTLLYCIGRFHGAGILQSGVLALLWMLCLRFVIVGSVCLYVAYTQKDQRMSLQSFIAYCVTEVFTFTLLYGWYQLIPHAGNSDHHKVCRQHVILLHGFMCNNGFWHFFEKQLQACGISYSYVECADPFSSIDDYAAQIGREVARVRALNEQPELYFVSFSMGGLAARKYLSAVPDSGIQHFSINTPYHGTQLARLCYAITHAENARQMLPESEWQKALYAQDDGRTSVAFYVYSTHDTIVIPSSLSVIDRPCLAVHGQGHMSATLNTAMHELLCNQIKASVPVR